MALVRRVDAEAIALQRQGELGLWPSSLGQEGAQIGAAYAMRPQDYAFPTYREHGVTITRGVDPLRLLAMFRGVDTGSWDVLEHNTYMYSIIIGTQAVQATGYGMGLERDGLVGSGDPERDAAVVCFFGDGATSQGDLNEGLVFASSYNAPVVFFCSNNQWAISEPIERQSRAPLYRRAAGFGIPGVRVDGNDALAVHAVTTAALERARSGNGPTFIEAYTYRMGAHTTSDDPTKYRLADELEHWRARDPLRRLRAYLERVGRRRRRVLRRRRRRRRRPRHAAAPRLPDPARADAGRHVRLGVRRQVARAEPSSSPGTRRTPRASRRPDERHRAGTRPHHDHGQGPERRAAAGHGGRPEGAAGRRGHRQARRRVPGDRGPAEGLRRVPGHRHPARRVRHRRHRGRPGHPRLPARSARSSSTASSTPPSTRSSPRSRGSAGARWAAPRCRSSSASRTAAASARSSTTASRPRPTSRTRPGSRSSPAPTRSTPTG